MLDFFRNLAAPPARRTLAWPRRLVEVPPTLPLLVVMAGAGISAPSGIQTYRDDADGLWKQGNGAENLASVAAFRRDPAAVAAFYEERRAAVLAAVPNDAHRALVSLEAGWPGELMIVTTNVDVLHEAAGSTDVRHFHGRLDDTRCPECSEVRREPRGQLVARTCPDCGVTGPARPDVVMFGEQPYCKEEAFRATDRCEIFLSVGCGGAVSPSSWLPKMAFGNHRRGERLGKAPCLTVEFNTKPTMNPAYREVIEGDAAETLPRWVAKFLDERGLNRAGAEPGG